MEHTVTLLEELRDYEAANAYTFDLELDSDSDGETRCQIFATEVLPPPEHWPLLAGEAVQNLRAALDHSIWAAWRTSPGSGEEGSHTGFPITCSSSKFKENRARLRGVPATVCASVERAQPYSIAPQTPERDGLALLSRLSNVDKHRSLATVASWVAPATFGYSGRVKDVKDWDHGTRTALQPGRNQIGSLVAVSDVSLEESDISLMYGYDVLIEGFPLGIVWNFVRRVFEALWDVETGTPAGPGAPYPLMLPGGEIVRLSP